jgi:isopentenyl-diphosphate delta-isomerase
MAPMRANRAKSDADTTPPPEQVILVNEQDEEIGTGEKLATHRRGGLHRAFSIFVFNEAGELLLQQRAAGKYHSSRLWSNTCCGHPRPGELLEEAAHRRLREEMGIDCALRESFSFAYRARLSGGMLEHELDHVFAGRYEGTPRPDLAEVDDWRWIDLQSLSDDLRAHPLRYTAWLKLCLERAPGWPPHD